MAHKNGFIAFISMICIFCISQTARSESDWEYWTAFGVTESINENVTANFSPELRYRGGAGGHYYTHFDLGLDWKVNDWLVLGQYYRHVEEKKNDDWEIEKRPHFNATVKGKLFGLDISNRGRLEYRIKDSDDKSFRYRNKLTAKLPKMTQFEIQPYVADEPFYDFDTDEFNKNRFYTGFNCRIYRKLKADVYYILESRKRNHHWTETNIFGINFKYPF